MSQYTKALSEVPIILNNKFAIIFYDSYLLQVYMSEFHSYRLLTVL